MEKNYYLILSVGPEATLEEIKSAYRRRALELHPDVSHSSSEPFLELQEAYAVLSDPGRREAYDERAAEVPGKVRGGEPRETPTRIGRSRSAEWFTGVEPAGGFREASLLRSFETFHPSFDELFDRIWSNFEVVTRPKSERLRSLTVDVPLSSEQARAGGEMRLLVPARVQCPSCRGMGAVGPYECWRCEGQGALTGEYPVRVSYPAGLSRDYVTRFPLDQFGIHNLYLTVRFRPAEFEW